LVSIGVPTYNRASQLQRAIESILAQDYPELELVISDNASADETQRVCEDFSARDLRVRYFRQAHNRGPHDNFVEVLKQAKGEFFMWLGDDDWLDQSYIGRCVQVLRERPDYSLVCGRARYFREGKFAFEGVAVNLPQERASDRVLGFYREVSDNGTFHGMMRRGQVSAVPVRSIVGGDWLYIAGVAFIGKVKTLEDVSLNRSLGVSTIGHKQIAEAFGYSRFAGSHPRFSIAVSAFWDILNSPVYSQCGTFGRVLFAFKVFALIARRDGFYSRRTPYEFAYITLRRILPAEMVENIRSWRKQRRAKLGE
jgi:glycosyltransferase involved in cell wall biosynthesis